MKYMTGWVIKTTYTDGIHKGHSYYMVKGGYCRSVETTKVWDDEAYMTESAAKRVCTMYAKNNERDVRYEESEQIYAQRHGRERMRIYYPETYEPVQINVVSL